MTEPDVVAMARSLQAREHVPRDQLAALQQKRLDALVGHARKRSAYYREVLPVSPGRIELAALPTLDKATLEAFERTQQYNRQALAPLGAKELAVLEDGARVVRLPATSTSGPMFPLAGNFLAQTRNLPGTPWNITVYSPQAQVRTIAVNRAA